jgi:glycine/D-amino acid oxidase-like deaminating enzyme
MASFPWPTTAPTAAHREAFAQAIPRSFWLDDLPTRDPHPPLDGAVQADLCIVGGGYTGLWAALRAKQLQPGRSVVLLEGDLCGHGASGRNGGFLDSSVTHGISNGASRFAHEIQTLERLGCENFEGLAADIERHRIDAQLERSGFLSVALEPHELPELGDEARLLERFGQRAEVLDEAQVRAQVDSPMYLGGVWQRSGSALVHPGRLADGLRRAAEELGVLIHERSRAGPIERDGTRLALNTQEGRVLADRVLLATSAYPPLLGAMRRRLAPIYDYALMTEPLSAEQRRAIGWSNRQGLGDLANRFHYYRQTADDRILFGGYEAVYRYGGPVSAALDEDERTFATLSQHFFTVFPQLEGLRFSHRWGGAIDTCSRFSVFFGRSFEGRLVYAVGYTGLGVGASRFGAHVGLDLLDARPSEATQLDFVATRPLPFPPEPLRSLVIQLTRNRLAAADRHEGRRGLWLTLLDRLGLGFDS